MKRNLYKLIALVLLTALLLCACSSNTDTESENIITFTDALGREISLQKPPVRVAALIGSFADLWLLAGGSICAAPEDAFSDFGIRGENILNIGGAHSPSTELLLSADPDFVIASASTASNVEMMKMLEDAGITVAYFDVDHFEDYLKMLDICTDITGRKDLYEKHGIEIQKEIDAIKKEAAEKNLSDEERTVLLLRAHSGSVKAKGSRGTVLGEMLSDLGLNNIADGDTALLENLSVESVIRQNPYRIFVVTMGNDTEKAIENLENLIRSDPAWSTLEAVSAGRVHVMDKKLFNIKPNENWSKSYEQLKEIVCSEK